jgi:hypothetical protein
LHKQIIHDREEKGNQGIGDLGNQVIRDQENRMGIITGSATKAAAERVLSKKGAKNI